MAKWNWFVNRGTQAGSSTFSGGSVQDANDANNETNALTTAANVYPLSQAGNTDLKYGRVSASAITFVDASTTNAGGKVQLAGYASLSTSGSAFQYDMNAAGAYLIRVGLGQYSAARNVVFVFEGTYTNLLTGTSNRSVLTTWVSGTSYTSTAGVIVSSIDKSVWICTTAGKAGGTTGPGVEPSGGATGSTFNDGQGGAGGAIWTKTARFALAIVDGTNTAGNVIDQNNAVGGIAYSAWPGAGLAVTITGTYGNAFVVVKSQVSASFFRVFAAQSQPVALIAVPVYNDLGTLQTSTPNVYAGQPIGTYEFRIAPVNGAASLSSLSLSGALAAYYTLALLPGGGNAVWIVQSAVIPDTLAGTRVLNVIQTDANAPNGTFTTVFNCNVISSFGKPNDGSLYAKINARNYANIKLIKNVQATYKWPGYTGQSYVGRDVNVNSGAALAAAVANITPAANNTLWYRITCDVGTYIGTVAFGSKNFGTGGLLIEPKAGVDPDINCNFTGSPVKGVHFRNLKLVIDNIVIAANASSALDAKNHNAAFSFGDPGPASLFFNVIKISGCRIGYMWATGAVLADTGYVDPARNTTPPTYIGRAAIVMTAIHGQCIEISDNDVWGSWIVGDIRNTRCVILNYNRLRQVVGDFFRPSTAPYYDSTVGVFPDNHSYIECLGNLIRNEADYVGMLVSTHPDTIQISTFQNNIDSWIPNSQGPNDDANTGWGQNGGVTEMCLNMKAVPPALYSVVRGWNTGGGGTTVGVSGITGSGPATGGNGLGEGPSGPNNGQIDGNVTWNFVANYTVASNLYFIFEDNVSHSSAPVTGIVHRQAFLDSNQGRNCSVFISCNNNVLANATVFGVSSGDGFIHAEYNILCGPARLAAGLASGLASFNMNFTGSVRSLNNIVAKASNSNPLTGTGRVFSRDTIVNFAGTDIPGSNAEDLLNGPFDFTVGPDTLIGRRIYPSLDDTGTNTAAAFIYQIRDILKPKVGAGTLGVTPSASTWVENAALATLAGLTSGTSRVLTGAAIDAGYVKPNNATATLVTGVVKGPNIPPLTQSGIATVLTFNLKQTDGGGVIDNQTINISVKP